MEDEDTNALRNKLSFLCSFSEEELRINGHEKKDLNYIVNMYDSLLPYIKDGSYIELGSGTGILCSYICFFSGKNIVPHGIDINPKAIGMAKNNHPKFHRNFSVGNYLEIPPKKLSKFATIIYFIDEKTMEKKKFLLFNKKVRAYNEIKNNIRDTIKINKDARFIVFSYNLCLEDSDKDYSEFITDLKEFSSVKKVKNNFIMIEGK